MNYVEAIKQTKQKEAKRLFYYFKHLNERKASSFPTHWEEIEFASLSHKHLAIIIYRIACHLNNNDEKIDRYPRIADYLDENIKIWEQQAIEEIGNFNRRDLSESLWAFAKLGILPSDNFMNAWEQRAKQTITAFSAQRLANTIWSLAIIDSLRPSEDNKDRYTFLKIHLHSQATNPSNIKKLYHSDLWFQGYSGYENPIQKSITSNTEKILCRLFNKAGFHARITTDPVIPTLRQAIDFYVTTLETGQKIYSEFDGFFHFLNTRETGKLLRYNGPTLFRSRLMEKEAPHLHILRIDMDVKDQLLECERNKATLAGTNIPAASAACHVLFNTTLKQKPGIYRAHLTGNPVQPMFARHPV